MATGGKAFRARAFDANRPMTIFWSTELPDILECVGGSRAVTQMPSGMEKEEEMESHLQDAILAQQASTSGVQVNHVIPTPQVKTVEIGRYDRTYHSNNTERSVKYIKVHAWQALERDEPEYDYDTEDEEWLNVHPHIEAKTLEKIFDTVESNSSETQIANEDSVLNIHKALDPSVVYEVYEYWLSKRTSAATTSGCIGVGGLIPRVRNECRKQDVQGSVNPYVAFRRRAEKMQTRKNRKNDEDSYEKILKLVHDMSKARQLFDMTAKREKTKLGLIDMESEILTKRMEMSDFGTTSVFNEFSERMRLASIALAKPLTQINGQSQEEAKRKKKIRKPRPAITDKDMVSKAWLKKNLESWNRPPALFGQGSNSSTESSRPVREPNADGKFSFKRRRGCVYRAALPSYPNPQLPPIPIRTVETPSNLRFYETFLPNSSGSYRSVGFVRRRFGRGGRVVLDRLPKVEEKVAISSDPWSSYCVADTSRTFHARLHPFGEENESEDSANPSNNYFVRSNRVLYSDEDTEREWISRYQRSSLDAVDCEHPEKFEKDGMNDAEQSGSIENDDSEVERMDVESQEDAQVSASHYEREVIENGKQLHDKNEDDEDMDVDEVPDEIRNCNGGKKSSSPAHSPPLSGNGMAGRVEPTPVPAKMCGTVSDSEDWREPSGSPSESNSSTEWGGFTQEQVAVSFKAKLIGVDDDEPSPARTGARVVAPSIKDAMSTVTILEQRKKFILPSTIGT